jgi:hypothetical protein
MSQTLITNLGPFKMEASKIVELSQLLETLVCRQGPPQVQRQYRLPEKRDLCQGIGLHRLSFSLKLDLPTSPHGTHYSSSLANRLQRHLIRPHRPTRGAHEACEKNQKQLWEEAGHEKEMNHSIYEQVSPKYTAKI